MKTIKRRQSEAITRAANAATDAIAVTCNLGMGGVMVSFSEENKRSIEEFIVMKLDEENGI